MTGSGIECSPGAIGFAFGHVRRHPQCLCLGSVSLSPIFFLIILLSIGTVNKLTFRFSGDSEIIWTCLYALGSDISEENYESITVFRL